MNGEQSQAEPQPGSNRAKEGGEIIIMPRTLYIANGSPCSLAALLCVKAANIECELRTMDLMDKKEHLTEEFMKLNPMHCVPTVDDDGFVLWQSRAMMRYLVDSYGADDKLYPRDIKQRAVVDRHLEHDGTGLAKAVGAYSFPMTYMGLPADPKAEKQLAGQLADFERQPNVAAGGYLTGETMTIADISTLGTVTFLESTDYDFSPYPRVAAWIARCKAALNWDEHAQGFEQWKRFAKTPEWRELTKKMFAK